MGFNSGFKGLIKHVTEIKIPNNPNIPNCHMEGQQQSTKTQTNHHLNAAENPL